MLKILRCTTIYNVNRKVYMKQAVNMNEIVLVDLRSVTSTAHELMLNFEMKDSYESDKIVHYTCSACVL